MLSPFFKQRFPGYEFHETNYSMVSDSPFGPSRIHGTDEIMPGPTSYRFYASQLVRLGGQLFILATTRQDSGMTEISDPIKVFANRPVSMGIPK